MPKFKGIMKEADFVFNDTSFQAPRRALVLLLKLVERGDLIPQTDCAELICEICQDVADRTSEFQ